MGWQEPIGKHIDNGRVIGVVKDFHFASLHSKIEPLVLSRFDKNEMLGGDPYIQRFLVLNISGENISGTLGDVESVIMSFNPNHSFIYEFLDDALNRQYVSDKNMMKLIGIFAVICILISCLGLFALSAFTTEQRTKEIGIRKVLGSSSGQIILLLFRKILLLIIFGAVVASLGAYLAIDEWLTSFAYRIGISPWVFLLSAVITACVAFFTVAAQSYRTARANPVDALRYE